MTRARTDRRPSRPRGPIIAPDPERGDCFTLFVDGVPQSYVDVNDPTNLAFEYVRRIGDVLDLIAEPAVPLRIVHVGGAAMTIPRYVTATRTRSRQLVLESDPAMIALVREQLPLPRRSGIRVRAAEGLAALGTLSDAAADVVVLDAFAGGLAAAHLLTREAFVEVARVLGPTGVLVANIADGPGLVFARRIVATAADVWEHGLLIADAPVMRGRRYGNLVLATSAATLPVAAISRRCAGAAFPARVVADTELVTFRAGARPSLAQSPAAPPAPPPDLWD